MTTSIKDVRFSSENLLSKNDKIAIVEFINSNADLFSGDHMVGNKTVIYHHKTRLEVLVHSVGALSISKAVDGGFSYQYNCYANFLVKWKLKH